MRAGAPGEALPGLAGSRAAAEAAGGPAARCRLPELWQFPIHKIYRLKVAHPYSRRIRLASLRECVKVRGRLGSIPAPRSQSSRFTLNEILQARYLGQKRDGERVNASAAHVNNVLPEISSDNPLAQG